MDLWPYVPQRGYTESMEWLTDVIGAKAAEQRLALRDFPRHGYSMNYLMDPDQFAKARNFARARSTQDFLLPLWGELTRVGPLSSGIQQIDLSTDFAQYSVGKSMVVWESEDLYEVREVAVIDPGFVQFVDPLDETYSNAYVMPCRQVAFTQGIDVGREAFTCVKSQARFVATEADDLASFADSRPQYRSHDLVLDRAVLTSPVREQHYQDSQLMDSGTGIVWRADELAYATLESVLSWQVHTPEQLWALRSWLHTRRGRWKGFWMPTWNNDIVLTANIGSADTFISIESVGYSTFGGPGDILVVQNNGTTTGFQVTSAQATGAGLENLILAGAAGSNILAANVAAVYFLTFMRLDADRMELKLGQVQGQATLTVPVREVPVP